MSTPDVYNTTKSYVSLKQTLNQYMSHYRSASSDFLECKEKQFTETIDFIYDRFDENAFSIFKTILRSIEKNVCYNI